jgi:ATP-dependent Clp protease ATP-binding subunit ClpB
MQAVLSVTDDEGLRGVLRMLRSKLVRLPKVEPAPDSPSASRELIKLFTAATKEQKRSGAAYLGVDVVLRLLLDHVRPRAPRLSRTF